MSLTFTRSILFIIFSVTSAAPVIDDKDAAQGELGSYFEGDMVLTEAQQRAVEEATHSRNGVRDVAKRWPANTVVYHISPGHFSTEEEAIIQSALAHIASKSCIKFRPRQSEQEYAVVIGSGKPGCFAYVGYLGYKQSSQEMNLGKRCVHFGTVVHEFLHTIGFWHMQSTYDRDDYVRIFFDNIEPDMRYNFQKYSVNEVNDFEVAYDYGSILHYSKSAFAINKDKPTIVPLQEGVEIGQRKAMSESDVTKLNRMYCH